MSTATRYDALDWSVDNCPIGRAMEILGERWTVVVLREVFSGIRRFDDMRVRTTIPRQVLANRLAKLVEHDILRRVPYREPGTRQRYEYRLTEKGFDLYPMLIALRDWGDRYLVDQEGSPLDITHRDCGEPVHTEVRCAGGHTLATPREAVPTPGPGARRRATFESEGSTPEGA
ncbi:MAG TPA: helix-turn-helix domain-containing protein [Kribbella sp.]|nr:helix-turn-helix domain-containing protein [Kribbella sp.]